MTRPQPLTLITVPNWRRWPKRKVVCIRRPQTGTIHFFELACGHAKIYRIHRSAWDEVDTDIGSDDWKVGCPVCYMEHLRTSIE